MTGKPQKTQKLDKLSIAAQKLLSSYRARWDEKLTAAVRDLSEESYRKIIESLYQHLNLPTPLVVSVDSPMQLILMPALLRIRALSDQSTWQTIRESLSLPRWKKTIDALEEKVSDQDIERLIAGKENSSALEAKDEEVYATTHPYAIDSIFARPKGQHIASRLGFFEALVSKLDVEFRDGLTPLMYEWISRDSLFSDGGMPGRFNA